MYKIYTDAGISGTQAETRPGFLEMIEDAKKGLVSLICARDTSRFARNVLISIDFTRQLKSYGVEVFFYNDGIWSFEPDGEFRLAIISAISQDESRHISERVLSGQSISRDKQILFGNGNLLGYNLVVAKNSCDNHYVINEEQADTVRRIFELYLDGFGAKKICSILMQEGRKTAMGSNNWTISSVLRVLKNKTYCGYIAYQKSYTIDFLTHKRVQVKDETEHVYVKSDNVPAIIGEEIFDKAEAIRKSRIAVRQSGNRRGKLEPKDKWTKLLRCSCGHNFKKYKWRVNKDGTIRYGYQCYNQVANRKKKFYIDNHIEIEEKQLCNLPSWCDWKLELMALRIFKRLWSNTENIVSDLMNDIEENYEEVKCESDIGREKVEREYNRLEERINNLVDMRLDNTLSKEQFYEKYSELKAKLDSLELKLKGTKTMPQTDAFQDNLISQISKISEYLHNISDFDINEVDQDVLWAIVRRVIPCENGIVKWYIKRPSDIIRNEFDEDKYIMADSFVIDYESAREFRKSSASYLRVTQWNDISVEVYIEIDDE